MYYYTLKTDRTLNMVNTQSGEDKLAYGCHWRSLVIEGKLIEVGIGKQTRDLISVRSRHALVELPECVV